MWGVRKVALEGTSFGDAALGSQGPARSVRQGRLSCPSRSAGGEERPEPHLAAFQGVSEQPVQM